MVQKDMHAFDRFDSAVAVYLWQLAIYIATFKHKQGIHRLAYAGYHRHACGYKYSDSDHCT